MFDVRAARRAEQRATAETGTSRGWTCSTTPR
jgi:hypothetical protein